MSFQHRDIGLVIIGKLAIGPVADAMALGQVPNKAALVVGGRFGAFSVVVSATASVIGGPGLFEIVGCISA